VNVHGAACDPSQVESWKPPQDQRRSLGRVLLWGPRGRPICTGELPDRNTLWYISTLERELESPLRICRAKRSKQFFKKGCRTEKSHCHRFELMCAGPRLVRIPTRPTKNLIAHILENMVPRPFFYPALVFLFRSFRF